MVCPTDAFLRAAQKNGLGCSFLQQIQNDGAIEQFSAALQILNEFISSNMASDELLEPCSCPLCEASTVDTDASHAHLFYSVVLRNQQRLADAHDDFFALIPCAFKVSESQVPRTSVSTAYAHFVTAVLFYNIGLSHHLEGLRRGDTFLLHTALQFYYMSLEPLRAQQFAQGTPDVQGFLSLGSTNNIGHIHSYFRNIDETKFCSWKVRQLLSVSIGVDMFNVESAANAREEYRVSLLNIGFFADCELNAAPAA